MRNVKIKHFVLLLGLVLSVAWGNAEDIHVIDGVSGNFASTIFGK